MKAFIKSILPVAAHRKIGPMVGAARSFWLRNFRRDFSQQGETLAIRRLLKNSSDRTFVEIGANDGVTVSCTYGLLMDGWTGLSVEPNPRIFEKLQRNLAAFPKVKMTCCAASPTPGPVKLFLGKNDPEGLLSTLSTDDSQWFRDNRGTDFVEVPGLPLTDILKQNQIPKRFGLMVVDTEGMDLDVLRTLDFSEYRPRLIVTEDYEPKNAEKFALLEKEGYALELRVSCNSFWMDTRNA